MVSGCSSTRLRPHRLRLVEVLALPMFALLTGVELADRAMVAHDTCPDFAALTFVVREEESGR